MPANTPDQGLTRPLGPDVADNPVAFTNFIAGVENRLALRYTDEADRTARHPVAIEGEISHLGTENREEIYDGTSWVSLHPRSLFTYTRKASGQVLTPSSTALQSVTSLVSTLPTVGTFGFAAVVFYDSSTTADMKFAFLVPAGITMRWGLQAAASGGGGTGDGVFLTATASDAAVACGGAGVGTVLYAKIEGEIIMGGTGGNLQLRAAQNTSDPTNSTIQPHSRMWVWRSV